MERRILVFSVLLLAGGASGGWVAPPGESFDCPGTRMPVLFGLRARPLTLSEMVDRLERGCLALDDVRFRPGEDTIELLSPARFAEVARALGMARGAYRVTVPAETAPGSPPDTVQARRRGTRLRDELVHYGASLQRLLEEPLATLPPYVVPPGMARPVLRRILERNLP